MGNRGRPRGVSDHAADNLLPTGTRRAAGGAVRPGRAERRKLQRKVKRRRRRSAIKEIPLLVGVAVLIALVLKTFLVQAFVIPSGSTGEHDPDRRPCARRQVHAMVRLQAPAWRRRRLQGPRQLAGRGEDHQEERPRRRQAGQRGPDGHRPAALRQRQGPHQAGRRGRRRHREVLRHPRARDRQRHAAQRAVHPGREQAVGLPVRGDRAQGPSLGDGRPPSQLGRLPLPPHREIRRYRLREFGRRQSHGHRLALRALDPSEGTGHVRVRTERVGNRPRPVA
jgi:hypothetical protein